jgi:hypothetical protein
VILQGTMQDGTVLPVQVDAQGRLVAEGLPGPAGPAGPPGADGGSFALPPNPTEGDVLSWTGGQLVWTAMAQGVEMYPRVPGQGYAAAPGEPYIVGVTPANASLHNYGGPVSALFDGNTSTGIYLTANGFSTGNVSRLLIDLRDYVASGISNVEMYYGLDGGQGYYFARLCALSTALQTGEEMALIGNGVWRTLPHLDNCRYIEVYFKDSYPYARVWLFALRVNGVLLTGGQWASAVSVATPY